MKGIAHFAAGVAVASCFPQAVQAGADGNPLPFLIGGACGLLPDTLDFKFSRFFFRHDVEVVPDPLRPDAQTIADAVALAVNRAWETQRPVRIRLHTIRLATDVWLPYEITFDVAGRRVLARCGSPVDTGGNAVGRTEPAGRRGGAANLACGIKLEYRATTPVDMLEGPTFTMEPTADGRVVPRFIEWHRQWSHSLLAAAGLGLLAALAAAPYLGLVAAGAALAHVLADQLGFMGSNLFFPFRAERSAGLQRVHSESAAANLLTVWGACVLIFWNLYRNMAVNVPGWNLLSVAVYGLVVPAGVGLAWRRWRRRHGA